MPQRTSLARRPRRAHLLHLELRHLLRTCSEMPQHPLPRLARLLRQQVSAALLLRLDSAVLRRTSLGVSPGPQLLLSARPPRWERLPRSVSRQALAVGVLSASRRPLAQVALLLATALDVLASVASQQAQAHLEARRTAAHSVEHQAAAPSAQRQAAARSAEHQAAVRSAEEHQAAVGSAERKAVGLALLPRVEVALVHSHKRVALAPRATCPRIRLLARFGDEAAVCAM